MLVRGQPRGGQEERLFKAQSREAELCDLEVEILVRGQP